MSGRYLIQMHGEPGSGKSTLARALGQELPALVLDVDILKTALLKAGQAPGSVGPPAWEVMWDIVRALIPQGHSVVVDGPCGWPITEQKGMGAAAATGAAYRMVECVCPDREELARRLATRDALPTQPREIFDWSSRPGSAEPRSERVVVDMTQPLAAAVTAALDYVRSGRTSAGAWKRGDGAATIGRVRTHGENRGIWSGHP